MRAGGVLVRFLSLLDVALILLGVLMIALMHTQARSVRRDAEGAKGGLNEVADIEFVSLFAGWKGDEDGHCYLLDRNFSLVREVRMDAPGDLDGIVAERTRGRSQANVIVLLLFSEGGWYASWDLKKRTALEQTWGRKVVPVYNVKIGR